MIRPTQDWLIVELEPPRPVSPHLHMPDFYKEPVRIARVVAVGPGKFDKKGRLTPTEVKVGDRFPFFKAASDTRQGRALAERLPDNQEMVRESDVLFVMEDDVHVTV